MPVVTSKVKTRMAAPSLPIQSIRLPRLKQYDAREATAGAVRRESESLPSYIDEGRAAPRFPGLLRGMRACRIGMPKG